MSNLIEIVKKDVLTAVENDDVVLPTLPEVALRVREVAQDPKSTVSDLSRVIASDAAISARIIKICNSPLLRASHQVENLQMAVNRLGISYSADMATGLAMQQVFQATSEFVDCRLRRLWDRSTVVAGLAHVLAQRYTNLSPAQATLAGLLHKIGVLPILYFAEHNDSLLDDGDTLDNVIGSLHCELGGLILRAWGFSEELCEVPLHYVNFARVSERADLIDIVTVANLQASIGTSESFTQLDWSKIPAFASIGIDPKQTDEEEGEDLTANMEAAMMLLAS